MSEEPNAATTIESDPQRQARSGVVLTKQELKRLYRRSDAKGLIYFGGWLALTSAGGFLYYLSLPTYWMVPALMLYGTLLALGYAMSHETTHGTAFRTRWLNEAVFWFTSLIYGHEPYHRRYSHASHHTHTEIRGVDAQKPWNHPMTLWDYVKKISGIGEVIGFPRILFAARSWTYPREGQGLYPGERAVQPDLGGSSIPCNPRRVYWWFCPGRTLVGAVCVFLWAKTGGRSARQ